MSLKVGGPIRGDVSRFVLTSYPHLDTRRMEVRLMSREPY